MALSYIYSALLAIIVQASCLTPSVDTTYYNNTATALNGAITLYWNVYANDTIEVALVAQGTGWVGFGIGEGMNDADIILGSVVAGTVSVGDYFSTSEVPPQLDTTAGGTNNILDSNGQEVGGVTTIKFLRNLATGDSKDKAITNGSISIICAYNPTNDDKTVYHGGLYRQAVSINFFGGGGVTVITDNKNTYRVAHGVLMAFGWGFFIWVGMFIARFFKSLGHKWFVLHIILNAVGLAAVIAGFVLAIIMVDQDFKQPDKLTQAHSILGLLVVILGVLQPIIGTIADRLFDPNRSKTPVFPDMIHWWIGRISMLASIATIFMGFAVYDTGIAAFIIYAVWNLILLIGFIVLSVRKGTGHGNEIEMK